MVITKLQYQQALRTRTSRYTGLLALPAIKNRENNYLNNISILVYQKNMVQRQIDAADTEINRIAYRLYGLTEEEIKIVEGC